MTAQPRPDEFRNATTAAAPRKETPTFPFKQQQQETGCPNLRAIREQQQMQQQLQM